MITDWSKGSDLAKGLAFAPLSGVLAINKALKVVNNSSVWILRKVGTSLGAEQFLGKAMSVAAWKQLSEETKHCVFCNHFMPATGAFCPACGKARMRGLDLFTKTGGSGAFMGSGGLRDVSGNTGDSTRVDLA